MLRAIITQEELDKLDEVLQAFYKKQDSGKFMLQVQEAEGYSLEDVAGIKKVLGEVKDERTQLKTQLAAFEGIEDVDKAKTAVADLAKLKEEIEGWEPPEKWKASMDQREESLITKHKKELDTASAQIDDLTGQLQRVLIEAEATAAISTHKGNVNLLLPHVRNSTKMEKDGQGNFVARVLDNDGRNRISMQRGSTDPMGIAEYVESLKDVYPMAFEGTNKSGSGGGSGPSGGPGGQSVLSYEDAKDPMKYRAAKEAADKAGTQLVVAERE